MMVRVQLLIISIYFDRLLKEHFVQHVQMLQKFFFSALKVLEPVIVQLVRPTFKSSWTQDMDLLLTKIVMLNG